jgi:hypothetical protein
VRDLTQEARHALPNRDCKACERRRNVS